MKEYTEKKEVEISIGPRHSSYRVFPGTKIYFVPGDCVPSEARRLSGAALVDVYYSGPEPEYIQSR